MHHATMKPHPELRRTQVFYEMAASLSVTPRFLPTQFSTCKKKKRKNFSCSHQACTGSRNTKFFSYLYDIVFLKRRFPDKLNHASVPQTAGVTCRFKRGQNVIFKTQNNMSESLVIRYLAKKQPPVRASIHQ